MEENISVVASVRTDLDQKAARADALQSGDYTAANKISSYQKAEPTSEQGRAALPGAMNESVVEGVRALMDEDESGRHGKSDDDESDERPIESRDEGVKRIKQHAEKRPEPKAPPPRAVEADDEPSFTAKDVEAITFLKTERWQLDQDARKFDQALRMAQQLRDPAQRAQAGKVLAAEQARIRANANRLEGIGANVSSAFQARELARHQQKLETGRQQLRKEFGRDFDVAKVRAFGLSQGYTEAELDRTTDVRFVRMLERDRRNSLPKATVKRASKPKPRFNPLSAKGVTNAVRMALNEQQEHKRWMARHGL